MKTLILAGFVALISFQALAASSSTCPFRSGGTLHNTPVAANEHKTELPNAPAANPQVPQLVKPAVRAAGADAAKL